MALATVSVGDLITATGWNAVIGQLNKSQETQSGSSSGTILSGQNAVTGTTPFPSTFTATPVGQAQVSSSGNWDIQITAISTTILTWRIFRTDGTNAPGNQTVNFNWQAFGAY